MLFWYGHRISTIHQAKAIMESTLCNISEYTKGRIELISLYLTIKSKMLFGFQMVKDLSSSQASSQLPQRCTTQMVNLFSSLASASGIPWRFVHLVTRSWLEALETSPKVRWTSGALRIWRNMVRPPNSHALRKWNGLHVGDTFWHRYSMKDWKLTTVSKSSEQMVQRSWRSHKHSKSFTILNGNLMKQEFCQNPILIS